MTVVTICGESFLTIGDLDRQRTAFPKGLCTGHETTVLSQKEFEVSFLNPHPGYGTCHCSTVANGM